MTRAAARSRRPTRSFVHRARRLTKAREKEFAVLWERYGRTVPEQDFRPETLFGRPGPITLEIGFGHGEVLLNEAQACARHNVLGIEVYRPALFSVLRKADQLEIDNLRVVAQDAAVLLPRFPDDCLQQIRILFPDPWPKRRHRKRRLLQDRFLAECARCLAPGGLLHLATDWPDYARQIEQVAETAACWGIGTDLPDRPETHFERRSRRLGHKVWERVLELKSPNTSRGRSPAETPQRLSRALNQAQPISTSSTSHPHG